MTERDAIKTVVEKSITRTVDIEVLRKWAKERYEISYTGSEYSGPEMRDFYKGKCVAYWEMIRKLDELEVNG